MSSDERHIVDTVVLLYFLLVGQEDLLCTLLGSPLRVPLAVYDPEDRALEPAALQRPEFLSEMRQALRHYERAASSGGSPESLARVKRVDSLYDDGRLIAEPMTATERVLSARLQSSEAVDYGLRLPLGPGEAACVAVSHERGWTIVTDDADALQVLDVLYGGRNYPYERIRRLLIRAASQGLVSPDKANEIHAEMRSHGFWDRERLCL